MLDFLNKKKNEKNKKLKVLSIKAAEMQISLKLKCMLFLINILLREFVRYLFN